MAGRSAHPWFYAAKNTWYVWIGERKVSLGVKGEASKGEAFGAWHRLMAEGPKPEAKPEATVKEIVDGFLADAEGRVSKGCLRNYKVYLEPFAEAFGSTDAEALTVTEAEAYCRKPDWSSTYRANFLGALVTAYRWAERAKRCRCPLQGLRRPPKASRGKKALVSEETHRSLCKAAKPRFKAFLELLWLTGARPGEIASLKAEEIDLAQGLAVLTNHKTAHLGHDRTIFLCPEAVAIIRSLGVKEGLLFPSSDGQKLTSQAIGRRLFRLCEKAKVKACIAYGYRHTFATDALAKGIPDAQVAGLLGHGSTAMLHRHYSHLTARAKVLKEAVASVRS